MINMPDITMCKGANCKQKEKCYRYISEPYEFRQSWFITPPFDEHGCKFFWEVQLEDSQPPLPKGGGCRSGYLINTKTKS